MRKAKEAGLSDAVPHTHNVGVVWKCHKGTVRVSKVDSKGGAVRDWVFTNHLHHRDPHSVRQEGGGLKGPFPEIPLCEGFKSIP